ncbi:hypothetical protein HETIRDRAFT_41255 [Heterobasidion irregulare TC 32-1]|uniref:Uncharacterized protein n=1 Tax=Heterobasidion irregulare (strain TC 32-1) TaxID=747525 RepID=W4KNX4_HETIT|nr:uncharacterized protein HETIRDRAFT_41255 [Heterobasidion irregulare TC 32-1]ETW86746.1 hypothetical protein HETIRDRAFT_41255 [Heterobasidion irregulare TC 32-1]
MHSSSSASSVAASASPSPSMCHSHKLSATPTVLHSVTKVDSDEHPFANFSSPQCCHCGWRGAHSPTCPFRRH